MNDLLFSILQVVITCAIAAICRYVIPYIATKLKESKYSFLGDLIFDAVKACEQAIQGDKVGAKRKEAVIEYAKKVCDEYHINITPEQIEALIESCVLTMKEEA